MKRIAFISSLIAMTGCTVNLTNTAPLVTPIVNADINAPQQQDSTSVGPTLVAASQDPPQPSIAPSPSTSATPSSLRTTEPTPSADVKFSPTPTPVKLATLKIKFAHLEDGVPQRPIEGAKVELRSMERDATYRAEGKTDSEGELIVSNVPFSSSIGITATKDGYGDTLVGFNTPSTSDSPIQLNYGMRPTPDDSSNEVSE